MPPPQRDAGALWRFAVGVPAALGATPLVLIKLLLAVPLLTFACSSGPAPAPAEPPQHPAVPPKPPNPPKPAPNLAPRR